MQYLQVEHSLINFSSPGFMRILDSSSLLSVRRPVVLVGIAGAGATLPGTVEVGVPARAVLGLYLQPLHCRLSSVTPPKVIVLKHLIIS